MINEAQARKKNAQREVQIHLMRQSPLRPNQIRSPRRNLGEPRGEREVKINQGTDRTIPEDCQVTGRGDPAWRPSTATDQRQNSTMANSDTRHQGQSAEENTKHQCKAYLHHDQNGVDYVNEQAEEQWQRLIVLCGNPDRS